MAFTSLLLQVLLPLPLASHSPFLLPRALSVKKSYIYLLPKYWPFCFLLSQSQQRSFTQCNNISRNNYTWFCIQVSVLRRVFYFIQGQISLVLASFRTELICYVISVSLEYIPNKAPHPLFQSLHLAQIKCESLLRKIMLWADSLVDLGCLPLSSSHALYPDILISCFLSL